MKVRGPRAALTFSLRAKYREGAYRGARAIPGLDFQTDALPTFLRDESTADNSGKVLAQRGFLPATIAKTISAAPPVSARSGRRGRVITAPEPTPGSARVQRIGRGVWAAAESVNVFRQESLLSWPMTQVARSIRRGRSIDGGGLPQGATKAPLLIRPRYLFIVSRQHPELYELLVERFQDDRKVEVILDRRVGPQERAGVNDRRQQRSPMHDLTRHSHLIITRAD